MEYYLLVLDYAVTARVMKTATICLAVGFVAKLQLVGTGTAAAFACELKSEYFLRKAEITSRRDFLRTQHR